MRTALLIIARPFAWSGFLPDSPTVESSLRITGCGALWRFADG